MAASVLGKRQRSNLNAEEPFSIQTRRKRTRNSTTQIHVEDAVLSPLQNPRNVQAVDHSPQSGTVSSKRTVPNSHTTTTRTWIGTPENSNNENEPPTEFRTPSAVRFKDAFAPATPKHRVRLPSKPLTPRTPRTVSTPSYKSTSVYSAARQLFAQNGSPTKLIGRDAERTELATFISEAVTTRSGGSIYVSGPPGTGKSALVEEVTNDLSSTLNLKVSVVNCVGIKASKDILRKVISDLCPEEAQTTHSEHSFLSHLFLSKKRKSASESYLVVLDEVDNLLTVDGELVYSLFEWALYKSSRLILVGIANALDLTDRFLPRLKARNLKPRLLPFMPYTAPQIASIITEKLRSTLSTDCSKGKDYVPFLHPAAIQLCSKKIASQTGDLRKVFNLIRRAIDCIERETAEKYAIIDSSPSKQPFADITNTSPTNLPLSPPSSSPLKPASPCSTPSSMCMDLSTLTAENAPRATVAHVARITAAVFSNDAVSRLESLNLQQKAVLCSLVTSEKKRSERDPFKTPSKSANRKPMLKDLFASYSGLCRSENVLCPLSLTEFRDVVASLDTLGLVQEASARASFITPTKTPSRLGNKNIEDKQFASTVSEKELEENLRGPGSEILKRLLHGECL